MSTPAPSLAYSTYWRRKQLQDNLPRFTRTWWWPSEGMADSERLVFDAAKDAPSVLDFGAGNLKMKGKFAAAGYRGEYQSLDIGEEFAHDYRDLDEVHRTFGAILCLDVIEHMPLEAGLTLLARLAGLLDPGGRLVIQTPNALCSRSPMGWDMTHVQVYNVADLWSFLTVQGLDTRGYRMCFTDRPPGRFPSPGRALRIGLTRILASDDAENVLMVARKAPAGPPATA